METTKALEILNRVYLELDTGDMKNIFEKYMVETLGVRKIDMRRKDKSNTYLVDGKSTNWNRVECFYYKDCDAYRQYGKFEFCIAFRKRNGSYLLIQTGSPSCSINRIIEISYGGIIKFDETQFQTFLAKHEHLFEIMKEKLS